MARLAASYDRRSAGPCAPEASMAKGARTQSDRYGRGLSSTRQRVARRTPFARHRRLRAVAADVTTNGAAGLNGRSLREIIAGALTLAVLGGLFAFSYTVDSRVSHGYSL